MEPTHEADKTDRVNIYKYLDLEQTQHPAIFQGLKAPWQVLPRIHPYLQEYLSLHPPHFKGTCIGNVYVDGLVEVGEGTIVEHGAVIMGPAIIGKHCSIRKGAYIRGNVIVGEGCVIGNSSECKNSILFNQVQMPHFNYVGDSVLGFRAHLAAGAVTSNLKLDSQEVVITLENGIVVKSGLTKFGAIVGDYCQIGCNAILNPGSLIGRNSTIYPQVSFRGSLASNHICKLQQSQVQVMKRGQKE